MSSTRVMPAYWLGINLAKWLYRAGYALLLFLVVWAPIPLGSNRPWAWAMLGLGITATALIALFHQAITRYRPISLKHSGALWLVLLPLPIMAGLQLTGFFNGGMATFLSTADPGRTMEAVVRGLLLAIHALTLLYFIHSEKRVRGLLIAIVASSLLQALYALVLLYGGFDHSPIFGLPITNRATGSFVYKNHLANFLLISLSMGIGLMVSQFERNSASSIRQQLRNWLRFALGRKMIFRVSLIILVCGLILTRSRMGNSAFFTALLVTSLIAYAIYRDRPKAFTAFVISIFVMDILLLGGWIGLDKVTERLQHTDLLQEERATLFENTLPVLLDKPYTGHGAGSFYTVFNQYQKPSLPGFYDHAHNDYLEFATEYGLPITLLVGFGVLWCAALNARTMRQRHTSLYKGCAFGCLMAIVAMLIHGFADFNLQAPANAHLFVTVLALTILAATLPRTRRQSESERSRYIP